MAFGRYSPSYDFQNAAFWRTLLGLLCILTLVLTGVLTPPEDPVKCVSGNTNCTVTNSYGAFPDRSTCRVANVAYPTTEAELVSIVAAATKAGRKMRVTTRYSHSITKLACTDGTNGLLISTKFLNHTVQADARAMTLTVESGMTLRQLIAEAAMVGLALPYAPYCAVHDYVTEIRMVSPGSVNDGFAKDFADQAVTFGEKHEFADLLWLPSQGKVVYRRDDRVAVNT
ncbi:unnamed protein product [Arabis nemorensis]|uniref:FAD-binding PCMH-type domain-containing protein n=1 Tax=Arabis nemorensis TaxID=586526 RepID=A0A565BPP1_9BRAS|nr:unnamed protein product [Arabis nemorensis]